MRELLWLSLRKQSSPSTIATMKQHSEVLPTHVIDQAMVMACNLATYSRDPSSQTGAVIVSLAGEVIGTGYNDLSTGIDDIPENWQRPRKYKLVEHAERSALYQAARLGKQTLGAVMVSPWIGCTDCDRGIVAAGVQEIVRIPINFGTDHWSEDIALGDDIMRAAGVKIIELPFEHLTLPALRRNGVLVDPRAHI